LTGKAGHKDAKAPRGTKNREQGRMKEEGMFNAQWSMYNVQGRKKGD